MCEQEGQPARVAEELVRCFPGTTTLFGSRKGHDATLLPFLSHWRLLRPVKKVIRRRDTAGEARDPRTRLALTSNRGRGSSAALLHLTLPAICERRLSRKQRRRNVHDRVQAQLADGRTRGAGRDRRP